MSSVGLEDKNVLSSFLESVGLQYLLEKFLEEDLTLELLTLLSEENFKELGLTMGQRKMMMRALAGEAPAAAKAGVGYAQHAPAATPAQTAQVADFLGKARPQGDVDGAPTFLHKWALRGYKALAPHQNAEDSSDQRTEVYSYTTEYDGLQLRSEIKALVVKLFECHDKKGGRVLDKEEAKAKVFFSYIVEAFSHAFETFAPAHAAMMIRGHPQVIWLLHKAIGREYTDDDLMQARDLAFKEVATRIKTSFPECTDKELIETSMCGWGEKMTALRLERVDCFRNFSEESRAHQRSKYEAMLLEAEMALKMMRLSDKSRQAYLAEKEKRDDDAFACSDVNRDGTIALSDVLEDLEP